MKKVLITALVLILLSSVYIPMLATSTPAPLVFSAGREVEAPRGREVMVPISVSGNGWHNVRRSPSDIGTLRANGFAAVTLKVWADSDVMSLSRVEAVRPRQLAYDEAINQIIPGEEWQWISLVTSGRPDNWSENGEVARLFFDVKSDAPLGRSNVTIGFTADPEPNGWPAALVENTGPRLLADTAVDISHGNVIVVASSGSGESPPPNGGGSPTPPGGGSPAPPGGGSPTPPGGGSPAPTGGGSPTPPRGGSPTPPGGGSPTPPGGGSPTPPGAGGGNSGYDGFGNVPQTGVPSISGTVIVMWASILMTAALNVCLYFYLKAKRKRENSGIHHEKKY